MIWYVLMIFVWISWLVVGWKINYPPTIEQLNLIMINVWFMRIVSLLCICLSLFFLSKVVKVQGKWLVLVLSISPVVWGLWMCHPIICLEWLVIAFLIWNWQKAGYGWRWIVFILGIVLAFNLWQTKERSPFFYQLSLRDAQRQVIERLSAEDGLRDKVSMPLFIRRISYNKFYFLFKNVIQEVIKYPDLETWFFGETHPLQQKALPLFLWPVVFLFGLGLIITRKSTIEWRVYVVFLVLGFFHFITSGGEIWIRFSMTMWILALIISEAVRSSYKKWIIWPVYLISFYGLALWQNDILKRPDYWLDNRPLVFQFWYESLKNCDWKSATKIQVSSVVGDTSLYCRYYFGKSCDDRFMFSGFSWNEVKPDKGYYLGFAGEYVGSEIKNNIDRNWMSLTEGAGGQIIDKKIIRDNIAYGFGNEVAVVRKY